MNPPSPVTHNQLDHLLTGLVEQVAHVRHAVVLSEDGLVVSKSTSFSREDAERLAATSSGLMSLSRNIGAEFGGGPVHQSLIEMHHGFLILTSAGAGTHLAVLTMEGADVGVVAYEMNMLVRKIGGHLGTAPRGQAIASVSNGE